MEKWKPVKGYEELYEVSSMGRVRSLDRYDSLGRLHVGRILRPKKNKNGYLECNLFDGGSGRTFRVHKLVAVAFIPNPDKHPQVNHIDEDKTNNVVENLEWCSAKYNTNYGSARKRNLDGQKCIKVEQFTKDGTKVAEYYSMKEAGRCTGIHDACISKVVSGKTKQAGGYIWRKAT